MPIPIPAKGEKKEDFISRCMSNELMRREYPGGEQLAAVCNAQWRGQENKAGEWIKGLTLADQAEPRKDIMLFPFGDFEHPIFGKMKFNNKFFQDIIDNFESDVLQVKPFMDAEHDKGKALAWFNEVPHIRQGKGLFVRPEYTELGEKLLGDKEYMYFSPWWMDEFEEPQTGRKHKNVWRGGAATNTPFLKVMPPITDDIKLSTDKDGMAHIMLSELIAKSGSASAQTPGKGDSDKNIKKGANMKTLAELLGLPEGTSQEDAEKKLTEIVEKLAKIEKELAEKKEAETKAAEKEATEKAKKEAGKAQPSEKEKELSERLETTERKLVERDCAKDVGKALEEGKIKPADKDHWNERYMSDPEGVKKDLEHMHPVIDLKVRGSDEKGIELSSDDPGKQLVEKAKKLVSDKMSYREAFDKVCAENPDLEKEYNKKYGGAK